MRELGELVRRRKVSSLNLTNLYLARLKKYNPTLNFVVNLTEERALAQAKEADKEIAAGKYRSMLHGIPWGAKDLLAAKGYPTTWGAGGFETQVIDEDATVVQRLDAAGAILIAKLSLGALASNDRWFGGQTHNPWNPKQGASGSSAGPASATSAGCVGFSIGSETTGSISGPSTRCGVTGLRPTYGFVPKTGAMTLAWTLDKLGPICRSVEDCALVMQAIWGPGRPGHFRAERVVSNGTPNSTGRSCASAISRTTSSSPGCSPRRRSTRMPRPTRRPPTNTERPPSPPSTQPANTTANTIWPRSMSCATRWAYS